MRRKAERWAGEWRGRQGLQAGWGPEERDTTRAGRIPADGLLPAQSCARADEAGSCLGAQPEVRGYQSGVAGGPAQGLDHRKRDTYQPRTVPPALTDPRTCAQMWGWTTRATDPALEASGKAEV